MTKQRGLSRRDFLRLSTGSAAGILLAACGAPSGQSAETVQPTAPAATDGGLTGAGSTAVVAEQPATAGDQVTLRIHERTWNLKLDYWKALGEKFTEDHPNVKLSVEAEEAGDKYNERILTMLAGGTIGDLFWVVDVENYRFYAAKDVLDTLTPFVQKDNYDLSPYLQSLIEFYSWDGNLQVLPTGVHNGPISTYYNKDLLEKAGLEEPTLDWTLDEFREMAKKIVNPEQQIWGCDTSIPWSEMEITYCRSYGGDILNKEGTESTILEPAAVEAYRFMHSLFQENKLNPPPGALQGSQVEAFVAGKVGIHINGPWRVAEIQTADPDKKLNWGYTLMPKGPQGRKSQIVSEGYPIPKIAKQKDLAWEFIKLMCSKEEAIARVPLGFIPPPRTDALLDPELMKDPYYELYAKDLSENPSAAPTLPHNHRVNEIYTLLGQETEGLWLGTVSVDDALQEVDRQLKEILAKPAP